MGYIYIFLTILFTVYGQLILKHRISGITNMPSGISLMIFFIKLIFIDKFVFSGLISAFFASIFWMATLSKFEINYAYPFMALNFLLIFLLSMLFFHESINIYKIIGLFFIIIGVIISGFANK